MRYATSFAATLLLALPVFGHHSDAGVDMDAVVAFQGTVARVNWQNPHVYFVVETTAQSGEAVQWEVQMGPINVISRRGWRRDSLAAGDRVTVRGHPATDGRPYAILQSVDKEGGLALATTARAPEAPAATTTIAGNWFADPSTVRTYPGGFDGYFHAELSLTDKGRAAAAAYDPLSDDNPEATCIGRPTPALIISSSLYLTQIEPNDDEATIVIRSEAFQEERTIYMDGRPHPDGSERFVTGHSIGRWDDDTLVVDTANFTDHRSPYQIGVPSGAQKHVVETYRLTEDGTHIEVTFMLEDPEFIAQPLNHSRQLAYSPHLEMFQGHCDPEATRRFVVD